MQEGRSRRSTPGGNSPMRRPVQPIISRPVMPSQSEPDPVPPAQTTPIDAPVAPPIQQQIPPYEPQAQLHPPIQAVAYTPIQAQTDPPIQAQTSPTEERPQTIAVPVAPRQQPRVAPTPISKPDFQQSPTPDSKKPRPRLLVPAVALSVTVLVLVAGLGVYSLNKQKPKVLGAKSSGLPTLSVRASDGPAFQPVAPSNKPDLAKGGKGAAYDKLNGTYAFVDNFNGTTIAVSQEQKPPGYPTGQIAATKLAAVLISTSSFVTKYGTAYVVDHPGTTSQTIITPIDALLVTIQSSVRYSNDQWKSYIQDLR